jgi:hypothetical protein
MVPLMKTLIVALAVLAGVILAPAPVVDATGFGCEVQALAVEAAHALGETQAEIAVVSDEVMFDTVGSYAAGYAVAEKIVLAESLECRYVKSTTAHELAHVWQSRMIGHDDTYAAWGHDLTERSADCVAAATGWEDYRPYLGASECTPEETALATELRTWVR